MKQPTPSTADAPAQRRIASPRWSLSQQSELKELQSGQWWPFKRADPKVLEYLHKQAKANQIINAEEAWL